MSFPIRSEERSLEQLHGRQAQLMFDYIVWVSPNSERERGLFGGRTRYCRETPSAAAAAARQRVRPLCMLEAAARPYPILRSSARRAGRVFVSACRRPRRASSRPFGRGGAEEGEATLARFHEKCGCERERVEVLSARSRSQLRSRSRLRRRLNCSGAEDEVRRAANRLHLTGLNRPRRELVQGGTSARRSLRKSSSPVWR